MNRGRVAAWIGITGIVMCFGGIGAFYILRPRFTDGFFWTASSVSWIPGAMTGLGFLMVLLALAVFYSE